MNDRITVVVATQNRREELLRSLPRHEAPVVLVDNGSTDGTPQAVREQLPHVQVVEVGRNLGATARTVGVRRASTPYVAFADDDSWWAPGCLERAADLLDAHPRLGLLTGRILIGPDERPDPVSEQMADDVLGRATTCRARPCSASSPAPPWSAATPTSAPVASTTSSSSTGGAEARPRPRRCRLGARVRAPTSSSTTTRRPPVTRSHAAGWQCATTS
jgi:glycosyltransferase involved in cell wall biosynthesis